MKTHTRLARFSFAIAFLFPLVLYGQHFRLDPEEIEQMHHETPGDAYLPNKYNNKKTTPAFKYQYKNTKAPQLTGSTIFTNQVNVNAGGQNISDDAANEPNIAVNPLNPNEIVIGWRQFDNVISNFRQAGWAYSSDAGQTWTFPGVIDPGIFRSDPVLDYDLNGNFYYNSLTVNGNQYPCKVFESTNGGVTWNNGVDIGGGDKQWMTIDRTGGVGNGNIYSTWTQLYSFCFPDNFTRSSTGGSSFESCTPVAGIPALGTMAVGINGVLFIGGAGWISDTLVIAKSPNAKIPGSTINWNTPVTIGLNANIGFNTTINPAGLLGQVNIDIDRSSGPGSGNIYLAVSVSPFSGDPGDVIFMKSINGGTLWSAPQKINDDTAALNTQWFTTMSVAPNGRIDIVWLDTRDAPSGSDSSALYYSFSTDQGTTWSANEKMSIGFDPHVGYPNQDKMGDYFDMISDNNGAHLAWTNTFNGEEDVYYSHIVPSILTGKDEISLHSSFSVFPNPANGTFVIAGATSPSKIEITDMLGENVFSMTMLKAKNEINLSEQPSGIYFLKITLRDGGTVIKKIIRE